MENEKTPTTTTNLTIKSGHFIYQSNEVPLGVYCIKNGIVALLKTNSKGQTVLVRLAGKNSMLGAETVGKKQWEHTAFAVTDVQVCLIDNQQIQQKTATDMEFRLKLMQALCKNIQAADNTKMPLLTGDSYYHLAYFLLEVFDNLEDEEKKKLIHFPMQEMANLLGISYKTLLKTLQDLEKNGLIYIENNKQEMQILNPEGLRMMLH
jgi:CRP/FNR family transcriptional regulator